MGYYWDVRVGYRRFEKVLDWDEVFLRFRTVVWSGTPEVLLGPLEGS